MQRNPARSRIEQCLHRWRQGPAQVQQTQAGNSRLAACAWPIWLRCPQAGIEVWRAGALGREWRRQQLQW